jgi:hypothetical protein
MAAATSPEKIADAKRGSTEAPSLVPLEDRLQSPRFQKAMAVVGVGPDDLREAEPPVLEENDQRAFAAAKVRYELHEGRRMREFAKVMEVRHTLVQTEQGKKPGYQAGRYRTEQPGNVVMGLSRSLPGFDRFQRQSRYRGRWAIKLNDKHSEFKEESIIKTAAKDVAWQKSQQEFRDHEKMLAKRIDDWRAGEAKKQKDRVLEGAKRQQESAKKVSSAAKAWEKEGARRVEAFEEKCKKSEEAVAKAKADLFNRSCDRDEKIEKALETRAANTQAFVDKTYNSYKAMEEHLAQIQANKKRAYEASMREAGNQAELAAKERAALAAKRDGEAQFVAEKLGTRMKHLDEYLAQRDKEWDTMRKERDKAWQAAYGNVKKNVAEIKKDMNKRRKEVYERQEKVFEQGRKGLEMKQMYAGTRKDIEDAYREGVRINQELRHNAEEYKRQEYCNFWKERRQNFDNAQYTRYRAEQEFQNTLKKEITLNDDRRFVEGDIKSYGYRPGRHDKLLRKHGIGSDSFLKQKTETTEEEKK